ncbi:hypothetical protein BJV82DRAFT_590488 [Fennellomyces sp. T-0311]|nr:hypothetical protein BJV82DRAFT_590488 [Fennellomyces sp. T-0311]
MLFEKLNNWVAKDRTLPKKLDKDNPISTKTNDADEEEVEDSSTGSHYQTSPVHHLQAGVCQSNSRCSLQGERPNR